MKTSILLCIVLEISSLFTTKGANILAIFPYSGPSHNIYYNGIFRALSSKGHHIHIIGSREVFKSSSERIPENVTQIVLSNLTAHCDFSKLIEWRKKGSNGLLFDILPYISINACNELTKSTHITDILKGKSKYDVILYGIVANECSAMIAHLLKIPSIILSSALLPPYTNPLIANPDFPSYIPNTYVSYSDHMSLWQRIYNAGFIFYNNYIWHSKLYPALDEVFRQNIGEGLPPMSEVAYKPDMVFVNSDPSFEFARPYAPSVIRVPAVQCRPAKPLPKDLSDFVNGSGDDGFIFFSLGTILDDKSMPKDILKNILKTFSQIPQRVVWKWGSTIENLPPNVKIVEWAPQQDLLGHPKIRTFVTHCGLGSAVESIFHAVPIIAMPIFADQNVNAAKAHSTESGIMLEFTTLTTEEFLDSIKKVIYDRRYKENMMKRRDILLDKPMTTDKIVDFWVNHLVKHKGAPHLRLAALDLKWYQYYMLDIFSILALTIIFVVFIVCYSVSLLFFKKRKTDLYKKIN